MDTIAITLTRDEALTLAGAAAAYAVSAAPDPAEVLAVVTKVTSALQE